MKQDYQDKEFLIYNRDPKGPKLYLQTVLESIDKDKKSLTELGPANIGPNMGLNLWRVEKAEGKKYRMRNTYGSIKACYLTVCEKKEDHFELACTPLNSGDGKEDQLWEFELGKGFAYQAKCNGGYYLDSNGGKLCAMPHPKSEDDYKDSQQWRTKIISSNLSPTQVQNMQVAKSQASEDARKSIPKFCGQVYLRNNPEYEERIQQYASSSYPKDKMRPYLVVYPKTVDDISFITQYAKEYGKKVVARSGGHQYSGKSSGGDDTILVSMDYFNQVKYLGDNVVSVQPCCKLDDVSKEFVNLQLTVPHGECPLVNIGGHTQTGGYGHLLRGFGLIIDYVHDFDIVLADGTLRTVTRPALDSNPTTEKEKLNQQLFRGVLSGNAGSFGIVTRYTFHTIRDKDHPKSYCYAKNRRYDSQVFRNLFKVIQEWTIKIEQGNDAQLRGLDFMMSIKTLEIPLVEDIPFMNIVGKLPMMNIECIYADPDGGVPYSNQFDEIKKISESNYQPGNVALGMYLGNIDEEKPLSQCSRAFVRHVPEVTPDGREFKYPYKKRINATGKALTNEFVDAFCKKADQLCFEEPKVNLIFQMGIGGGQTKIKGQQVVNGLTVTGLPHRDILFNFVFDLFYEPGGEERAEEIQKEMQELVDKYYNHGQERRLFWGSFGSADMTDMSRRQVVKMYYDSEEQYEVLQALKAKVDPQDIFHTSFTVQLPGTTK